MDALRHAPWVHQSCPEAMDHFQNTVSACVSLLLCPGLCQYTLTVNVPSATLTSGGYKLGGQCPSLPISESSVHSILRGWRAEGEQALTPIAGAALNRASTQHFECLTFCKAFLRASRCSFASKCLSRPVCRQQCPWRAWRARASSQAFLGWPQGQVPGVSLICKTLLVWGGKA